MHLNLDGEKTHKAYEASGRQPSAQNGPVEYEAFDDRLTGGRRVYNGDTTLWQSRRVFPCTDRLWDFDKILHG